ncbi:ribonuclease HII [Patescibacteria group bacterium]|nr:ribonuclease HII [Patescibacteria group bacterium]
MNNNFFQKKSKLPHPYGCGIDRYALSAGKRHSSTGSRPWHFGCGGKIIIGIDEVGRGALAGPVLAVAVMVLGSQSKARKLLKNIKDSKKLSPKKREGFYKIIEKTSIIKWGVGKISEKIIDKINILEATKLAMEQAVKNLKKKLLLIFCDHKKTIAKISLLLDGNFKINLPVSQKSIIKGDEKVFLITLASVIAKVLRDRIMLKQDKKYPKYGFAKHKGYGTKLHLKKLKKYGHCKIHRKTFKQVY